MNKMISLICVLLPIMLLAQGENWIFRYNSPANFYDEARSIVYGLDGNIYAAGFGAVDFLVISLTPAGDTNWIYRYDGPFHDADKAFSIDYGADGNIYAAGFSNDSGSYANAVVISLSPSGNPNWIYKYNGQGNYEDGAWCVTYGADGNIYAAGDCFGATRDALVLSLTSGGDTNWVYTYDGPAGDIDNIYALEYGADGNIYAGGYSFGDSTQQDILVISLTDTGDTNWVRRYEEPGADQAYAIEYGADGNIYVAAGIGILSLNSTGDTNWVYRHGVTATSIVYGGDGNIYAAGVGHYATPDFAVMNVSPSGATNWIYRYEGGGNQSDGALSVIFGSDGNIYAAGHIGDNYTDFFVVSLSGAGDTNWTYRYNGPNNWIDLAYSLTQGADNSVYAAGYSTGLGTYSDFTVISLPPDLAIQEKAIDKKTRLPGPTIFSGNLRLPEGKDCRIYDISGRSVKTAALQPGVYFIEIEDQIIQKVVKVR